MSQSQSPLLSIVIPTRNEAEAVPLLVARVVAALPDIDLELCFVDDSDDDTPAVLDRLAAEMPGRVQPICRVGDERQGGLSTAVATGLRRARGRYVCVMDADLQHPPETIAAMLAAGEAGADLVVASRYVNGGSSGGLDGGLRHLVSRAATALARLLFREARRTADPLSGFFLVRRALVAGVEFRPVGFKILLELLVLLPDVVVADVPLRFAPRAAGASKASMGQGLQYLRHVRSLVLDVQGSARIWKFALVGFSGFLVFIPMLGVLVGPAALNPLVAFVPAFLLSLSWNGVLNRLWTYADAQEGEGTRSYVTTAAVGGLLMFVAYALLTEVAGFRPLVAGALSTVVAAVVNAVANRSLTRSLPSRWSRIAADSGVQMGLDRLALEIGADRAFVVPAQGGSAGPQWLIEHAIARQRAIAVVEHPSFRPQRRTNIEAASLLVVPILDEDEAVAAVVCERSAPRGFDQASLEVATRAVHQLSHDLLHLAVPDPDATRTTTAVTPAPLS